MYKNQLQELAQRSCFNLPSYACTREGPDHAPRFKASVNFNGEIFEGPSNCTTLRQAEHAAAEVALTNLSTRVPSKSLAAKVLDETGVYKNLLQETAHKAGLKLPVYTTVRSGPGHQPVFTCSVELAGMSFAGESAKTKKQAEKNAATAAWSALKQMPDLGSSSQQSKETESTEEQEEVVVNRILSNLRPKEDNRGVRQKQQQLQQHQRRRVVLGTREGSSASSHSSFRYNHKWRSLNPFSEASSMYPPQQQRCFSDPPPPTGSKIFPPMPFATSQHDASSSKDSTNALVHASNRVTIQAKMQEGPSQLEERQKDEEKMNGRSAVRDKSIELDSSYVAKPNPACPQIPIYAGRAFAPQNKFSWMMDQQTQMNTRPFSPHPNPSMAPATLRNLPAIPMFTGRRFHAPGIAPAVHIRSVIPVCAAPPPARPAVNMSAIHRKEEEGELSGATSKLNRLQL